MNDETRKAIEAEHMYFMGVTAGLAMNNQIAAEILLKAIQERKKKLGI